MKIIKIRTIGIFVVDHEPINREDIEYSILYKDQYIAKLSKNAKLDDKEIEILDDLLESNRINKATIDGIVELLKQNEKNYIFVSSLMEYLEVISNALKQDKNYFYRGVSYFGYTCIPSLYHNKNYAKNEQKLYKEFLTRFPEEFHNKTRLDTLATMQHYGLPTRLLDDTENPLVALYMVCNRVFNEPWTQNLPGEVIIFNPDEKYSKYFDSVAVSMLASIPLLFKETKEKLYNLIIENPNLKLSDLKEIDYDMYLEFYRIMKKENPAFDDGANLSVLMDAYFVKSSSINDRIIAQSGAFIICGLDPYVVERKFRNKSKRIFILDKNKILKELSKINISDETMLRDLDHVAKYLKNIYSK